MKKILLTVGLFSLVLVGRSQTVLNEVYVDPGNGKSEFFELYNSATVGSQSTDCFTMVIRWASGGTEGWYVLDLPNLSVGPHGYFVGASASPFNTQSTTGSVANFNWNDVNFRNQSTGGSLTKWQVNGGAYTDVSGSIPANLTDLFSAPGNENYIVLVFVNGAFNNGFIGGSNSSTLDAAIQALPDLPVDMNVGCADFTIDFSTLGAMEHVGSKPGSDNGYARTSDGKCGAWAKTSASVNHTPGTTNGSAAGLTGSLVTATEILKCNTGPGTSRVIYSITGVSGDATEADDFPVEIQLFYDGGTVGTLDGADSYVSSKFDATIADDVDSFTFNQNSNIILIYKTKRGCFDKVVSVLNTCSPLPVNFKSFTAVRNHSNVLVKWETMTEQNNNGFTVERNTGGSWQQVAYIPTQAPGGNSSAVLSYQFTDLNTYKGISQYRIRQVDLDAKSRLSEIRAVRGEGQNIKTIVYPNPSFDGRVNVVFEQSNSILDVSLVDMTGRTVKQWKGVTNNNIQIDNLTPGMYSLRVIDRGTGEQSVEKIIVNKR